MAQSTYTYELTEEQQNVLLLIMEGGNYRKRTVPYSLMSIEGDGFNCTLYAKEKHGRRKCCIQGGKAEDFVLFVLEPQVLGAATLGYENVLDPDRDRLFAAFCPAVRRNHSERRTSIGFCCAARHAGYVPKTTPTNDEISSEPMMFVMEASVGISA